MRPWLCWCSYLLLAQAACESEPDASSGGGAPPADTFVTSPCGVCSLTECGGEVDACSADAGCAAQLECLQACPVDVLGAADADCEAACPEPASAASRDRVAALRICRLDGPGAECPDCGVVSLLAQQCPSVPMEPDACLKCETENCCETRQTCVDDEACMALVSCMQACPMGASACFEQCVRDHPGGMPAYGPRMVCAAADCMTECGGNDPCTECVMKNCPNAVSRCWSDPDCFLMARCVGDCAGNVACVDGCLAPSASAAELLAAFGLCGVEHCDALCQ